MDALEGYLRSLSWPAALGLALLENVVIFALAVGGGALLARGFAGRRLTAAPRLGALEVVVAIGTVGINAAVTMAGLALYRAGIVHFRPDLGPRAWLDVVILFLMMDALMYGLHRLAHVGPLFALVHRLHHRYERPHALTLFVLSPFESASFGVLWLLVIFVTSPSWLGMSVYLALNVVFGVLGHIAVEPLPSRWVRWPAARHLATTTFHARHHLEPRSNFGFYTLLWDRWFGTLSPDYEARFGQPLDGVGGAASGSPRS